MPLMFVLFHLSPPLSLLSRSTCSAAWQCEMTAWVSPSAIFMWTNANTTKLSQQTRCPKKKLDDFKAALEEAQEVDSRTKGKSAGCTGTAGGLAANAASAPQKQQEGDGSSAQQPVHLSQEIHDEEGCCVHCRVHDYTRSFGPSCAEEVQGVKVHASVLNSDVECPCSPSCAKVAAELKGVEGKRGEISPLHAARPIQ
ncbi:unnamed protein product [Closterium sp. Naga37s-1]|nr:unnamed protein product [Closterium sp. Naga37s-1]